MPVDGGWVYLFSGEHDAGRVATLADQGDSIKGSGSDCSRTVRVAAFLAGPVRSLLRPAVHRTVATQFWGAFGGVRVLFARLYDTAALDTSERAQLLCVLRYLSLSGGVHGAALSVWSAPTTPGKAMPDGTALSACSFARGADLAVHPYMVQSLARQLATLRACFERMLAHEVTHGMKFDWVLRTRTDTAFLMPVPPHCHVDSAAIHTPGPLPRARRCTTCLQTTRRSCHVPSPALSSSRWASGSKLAPNGMRRSHLPSLSQRASSTTLSRPWA